MTLNGVDVASHQANLNAGTVDAEFVICKATQGTWYVNPVCDKHYQQAKAAGKLLGVYHYAEGGDPKAEADYFLANIKGYIKEAILCLDWEPGDNARWGKNDSEWVKTWCDYVYSKTGVRPIVYIQASAISRLAGIGDYGLWIAQYASNDVTGYQAHPWNEGAYACAIRQYSSCGQLPGYSGRLDLDKFYGDKTTWLKYAGTKATAPAKKPAKPKITIPVEKQGVYRLYNPNSGEHVFTAEQKEAQNLADAGWTYEGIAWHETGSTKIYRMRANNEHIYLPASDEYAGLDLKGWEGEKIAFMANKDPDDGLYPVFRLYNKSGGHHMYTISEKERDNLVKSGWKLEGVAFYEHK